MITNNSLYGITRNFKFGDVWADADSFIEDYHVNGIVNTITDEHARTLFYLLYAQYGYSTSATPNKEQFKYKIFSIIYRFGPTWEKRLEIQDDLRSLNIDDIQMGTSQIHQHGYNPGTPISSDELIESVDDQNIAKYKKGKIEAYGQLWAILKTDVTTEFINKFKQLFKVVVAPELPLWYETEEIEEGDEE